jgi:hypothetical protein
MVGDQCTPRHSPAKRFHLIHVLCGLVSLFGAHGPDFMVAKVTQASDATSTQEAARLHEWDLLLGRRDHALIAQTNSLSQEETRLREWDLELGHRASALSSQEDTLSKEASRLHDLDLQLEHRLSILTSQEQTVVASTSAVTANPAATQLSEQDLTFLRAGLANIERLRDQNSMLQHDAELRQQQVRCASDERHACNFSSREHT